MQWHPFFAYLPRLLLDPHSHVDTNVAVGDLPREADLVLLRRPPGILDWDSQWTKRM